jgi:hypothetical protein
MSKKIKEQIEYEGPERMDPSIQSKLEKGETPFSQSPALPRKDEDDEEDNSFEQLLASKRFKDVVDKVKRYTGMESVSQNQLTNLGSMLMRSVQEIKQIESNNEGYLEQLAVDLVKRELGIPDDAFQYDVEIMSGRGQIGTSGMQTTSVEPEDEDVVEQFGVSEDEAEDDLENFIAAFEKFDLEKAKRRFVNSLIQGASKKGHYMFHMVEEELNKINPRLLNLYGVVMSVNDLLYWILPDQMTMSAAEGGQAMEGKEEVDDETDPPTIIAKGLFFPILVHEIIKGVYEALGTQGLPDDPKAAEMVMASQDTLPYEIWDLRLGPVFWEKFTEAYPDRLFDDDKKIIQSYLFSRFSSLTTDEFFELAKYILSGDKRGTQIMNRMVDDIIEQLQMEDYEDAMSAMEDDDEDDALDNLLGDLGISLS